MCRYPSKLSQQWSMHGIAYTGEGNNQHQSVWANFITVHSYETESSEHTKNLQKAKLQMKGCLLVEPHEAT